MRNKLKIKNKLNDTFIFQKGKEREKKIRKKSPLEPNHYIIMHTRSSNRKITARRFQHHPWRQNLEMERRHTRHLKGVVVTHSLEHASNLFLIIFILIERLNHLLPTCLLLKKKSNERHKKSLVISLSFIFF